MYVWYIVCQTLARVFGNGLKEKAIDGRSMAFEWKEAACQTAVRWMYNNAVYVQGQEVNSVCQTFTLKIPQNVECTSTALKYLIKYYAGTRQRPFS
jgi:hypothetical protein